MSNSFSRRRAPLLAAALAAAVATSSIYAAEPAQPEVTHLIDFVRASSCTFIRNGSDHTSAEAADHIAMKAGYAGSRITNGDTLIDLVASKSSMTGQPYYVQCPGADKTESGLWLHGELEHYRAAQSSSVAAKP